MVNIIEKPKLRISGYRGIWGQDFNEEIAFQYVLAFVRMIKNKGGVKILIGRDARPTGSLLTQVVKHVLEQENLEYEYAGIIPTPSMLLLVKKLSFDGGIMITASHNPKEYNGLKFIASSGLFANQDEIDEVENIKNNFTSKEKYTGIVKPDNENYDNSKFRKIHLEEVLKNIDIELIKSRKFKVALDPINSTGSIITRELLEALGCDVFIINEEQNGQFTHMPEPRPENLGEISQAVSASNADVGFAQDPDADRLVVVDEKGKVLNEEYTLALALKSVLSVKKGNVVINLSTSSVSEEVALLFGAQVFRSKIGEPQVVEKMQEINALIGGEGNGGVIYPKINTARDSLVGIGLILELISRENKKISEIADSLPKYFMKKEKVSFFGNLDSIYQKIKNKFPDAKTNELDGLRLDWVDHSWIHIRPSNTEPVVRIFGEAKNENRIDLLFKDIVPLINS